MSNDNLKFWNSVKETNTSYTKIYNEGDAVLTAINPTYTAMKATEKFGMYGEGWGVDDLVYCVIKDGNGNPLITTLNARFWYHMDGKRFAFPIASEINFWNGKTITQNQRKSLLTDVTGKALSKLGFNADVYAGQFDDISYVDGQKLKFEVNDIIFNNAVLKQEKETIRAYLTAHETPDQIKENLLKKFKQIDKKTEAILKDLTVDNIDETLNKI